MTRELGNTLYVLTQGAYIHLDHGTVRVEVEGRSVLQVPLHHLEGLAVFGNVLLSPFLIRACSLEGKAIAWFDEHGHFHGRLSGPTSGNVLLRVAQYENLKTPERVLYLARQFVAGKIRNSRTVLQRAARESADPESELDKAVKALGDGLRELDRATSVDEVRGIEGQCAAAYFGGLGLMIREGTGFEFGRRVRRPPRDPVNSLLSFAYTLLTHECAAALEGVGLDPQVGYLHSLRPGRPALALDLVEELRPVVADRLVLSLINRMQLTPRDFVERPGGAVVLTDTARRTFLAAYQQRKREEVTHPLLQEQVPMGLVPHVQARLIARYLRGDTEQYRPFLIR